MLILSLLWVMLGLLMGALANAANLRPAAWVRGGRLGMLGLGALAALLGHVVVWHTLCNGYRHLDSRAWRGAPTPADHMVQHLDALQERCTIKVCSLI